MSSSTSYKNILKAIMFHFLNNYLFTDLAIIIEGHFFVWTKRFPNESP